ncbi:MAG TPA: STAS domain-containing protein [Aggregatilineales bacterium]|jgi:anti-sigma B factor antagonist|nr:STAS domain-containing protein [Aggregatilineales bacterium]
MMVTTNLTTNVRKVNDKVSIIDISGEITRHAEERLSAAFEEASNNGVQTILLNFAEMEYMNSSGIGLLIMLLIRAQRQGQQLMAYGLREHYAQIFELTRLNEAIQVYDSEDDALKAAAVTP